MTMDGGVGVEGLVVAPNRMPADVAPQGEDRMSKITDFWNTLVTRDLERSRTFYAALGFAVEDTPVPGGLKIQPTGSTTLCLFRPEAFTGMIPGGICDTARAQEIVQSVSVDTSDAVDELLAAAREAGGREIGQAKEQPWGYAGGFADPDGHVWAVLWFEEAAEDR